MFDKLMNHPILLMHIVCIFAGLPVTYVSIEYLPQEIWHSSCPTKIKVEKTAEATQATPEDPHAQPSHSSLCDYKTGRQTDKEVHHKVHTGKQPFQCHLCPQIFLRSGHLKQHLRTHGGKQPYQCSWCDKTFSKKFNLTEHQRIHTGERPFSCHMCPECFTWKSNLKEHLRTHTGERPFQCSYCSKSFSQPSTLSNHRRLHTGEQPYRCTVCSKRFVQKKSLTFHMRSHNAHSSQACPGNKGSFFFTKLYSADLMDNYVVLVLSGVQVTHLVSFCAAEKHDCGPAAPDYGKSQQIQLQSPSICDFNTERVCDWKVRRELRLVKRPFQCHLCPQRFPWKSALNKHLRTHTGERPFQCSLCLLRFSQQYHLRSHLLLHTGERPHSCIVCSKSFGRKSNLKRHMKSHYAEVSAT
ncbi:uncharacterized protein LOC119169609 [Rhipicephalus microplus]|uniref:uncharacterized protein LOC119169609 n=1 Tax=Rhipicephalus microplus TaxID=6941 RepID=UPI003F6CA5D8